MARELQKISEVLDRNPQILDLVLHNLCDKTAVRKGAGGLSAELVLRSAILKQMYGFSYEALAFHLRDSESFRWFARIPMGWIPNKSSLQRNIASISALTWRQVNEILVKWAAQRGLETGEKIRVDSTAVASEIHHPTDSELLYDGVRTITRLLHQLQQRQGELKERGEESVQIRFSDHRRRAKKRRYQITNRRGERRHRAYRDLLKVSRWTREYGRAALGNWCRHRDANSAVLLIRLEHFLLLLEKVIDQTERRVLRGQSVPAQEKLVSLFEVHSHIIKKGQREPVFGHKVFLSCGPTSLISNCLVVEGNPADSTLLKTLLKDHQDLYGISPRQLAADQGFYSQDNLDCASRQGIEDVSFERPAKARVKDPLRSAWVYRQLRRFRAGIEGCISWLKRVFGLRRCTWKGWDHFCQYVQLSVVSYNLLVLARLLLR